jgi:hypothetical protein
LRVPAERKYQMHACPSGIPKSGSAGVLNTFSLTRYQLICGERRIIDAPARPDCWLMEWLADGQLCCGCVVLQPREAAPRCNDSQGLQEFAKIAIAHRFNETQGLRWGCSNRWGRISFGVGQRFPPIDGSCATPCARYTSGTLGTSNQATIIRLRSLCSKPC